MKMPLVTLALVLVVALAAPAEEKVEKLKGYYDFSGEFEMYSGYLILQEEPLIANHYVFVTSKDKPATDDLVLWSQGGPGCSSMIGFLQEIGPHLNRQGTDTLEPTKNVYAWNRHANLLFIDSPPGVGFSINNDPAYVDYNDPRTAQDNLNSLKAWFKKFPEFTKNRFWLSGQSYAGMYLPYLAEQLIKNKGSIIEGGKLDFQGMMIGNGAMDIDIKWRTKVPLAFFDTHSYFGPEIHTLFNTCKWDASDESNPTCQLGLKLAAEVTASLNPYNTNGICYQSMTSSNGKRRALYNYAPFHKKFGSVQNDEPLCSVDASGLVAFLNDETVQEQLHINTTLWEPCSTYIWDHYTFWNTESLHLFPIFKEANIKMMLFSGNVDAVVPSFETEEYLRRIGWKMTTSKHPVYNPVKSLEGWVTKYENNMIYYIINAAGHLVNCEKPGASLRMFENFIQGKL